MKTGITPAVTHKKSWKKNFFYWSKWFKILWEPSLGPKLRPKMFLWPNLKNSWFYPGTKKKSIKIFWKMAKNAKKIFKIQMWVSGRNRPIFGRKVADRVRSSQNSGQNFFHDQISKIGDFIQESRPPPPKKKKKKNRLFFGGGGGVVSYMELIPDII